MAKDVPASPQHHQGPRPLALHLGLQTMSWISSIAALQSLSNGSLSWSPRLAAAASDLVGDLKGVDPDDFRSAVEKQSQRQLADFANGVSRYRSFRREPRPEDPPVIWSEGTTRLLDFGGGAGGRPVLFVPSLVNRGYILDLSERRSLLRNLAERGFRPLLVDWGAPGNEETGFSLDEYIAGRLDRAFQAALDLSGQPVAVAGYCMGGLMALALAAIRPQQIPALVLMATPWEFGAMDPGKIRMLGAMTPTIENLLKVTPTLPEIGRAHV